MGDIADSMLDGTLCEGCGLFLGAAFGVPLLCLQCSRQRWVAGHQVQRLGEFWQDLGLSVGDMPAKPVGKVKCPACGRLVKRAGLQDHTRAVHGAPTGNQELTK